MATDACPICRLANVSPVEQEDFLFVDCPRCGSFACSSSALPDLGRTIARPLLSAWIRNLAPRNSDEPFPKLTTYVLERLAASVAQPSVGARQELFLEAVAARSRHPGHEVRIDYEFDFPLAWAESAQELTFYLEALAERGLIHNRPGINDGTVRISGAGWDHLEDRTRHPAVSDQGFVAMSFAHALTAAWADGIKPAIEDNRYRPHRVDAQPHLERIDAKIISEIRRSKFLIADVTGQRPGVYYEAGFAQGLGLTVIWCVREDEKDKTHFDTRQFVHLRWNEPADLREKLRDFIGATIGKRS